MSTTPAIEAFFKLRPASIRQSVKVVTPATLGQPALLHISMDHRIPKFTPSVTKRTAEGEDRLVPRVSTAPTLVGCMIGYNTLLHDFERPLEANRTWTGCWKLYGLAFEHALRPNHTLVPDVECSDEHWVITYTPETVDYPALDYGEFFVESVQQYRVYRMWREVINALVHVAHPDGLFFDQQHHLEPGYWRVEFIYSATVDCLAGRKTRKLTRISERDYQVAKSLSLSASVESLRPASLRWK